MANVFIEESTMQSIGDAIREKTGKSDKILPADMANEIREIKVGVDVTEPYIEETYDESGNLIAVKMVGHTQIRKFAFYKSYLHSIELPEGIVSIGIDAFYDCNTLSLTRLPETITSIGAEAFGRCSSLALTEFSKTLTTIEASAFYGCTSLKNITFKGTPTTISSSAFGGCTNLKTINVPWSEGAVANAPWGATNATINYDYVEE